MSGLSGIRLSSGFLLNNAYEILSSLGEGGYAVVYKAKQKDLNRIVAIKLLHEGLLNDDDALARFSREGRILANLKHPLIVTCYATGLYQGRMPFLVFEYVEGKNLRQILNEKKTLSLKQVLELGIELCDALWYAHQLSVVHRDLKPENIILLQNSERLLVKVLDFGLARVFSEQNSLTKSGLLVGSAVYMSPEQCKTLALDGRSDIYSVACILYECLAGKPPFQADSPVGLLYMHVNQEAESISSLNNAVPGSVENVLFKAMAKNKEERYQTADDFRKDLLVLKDSLSNDQNFVEGKIQVANSLPRVRAVSSKAKKLNIVSALIWSLLFCFLAFSLSDPGLTGLLLSFYPSFEEQARAERQLEELGDWLGQNHRNQGACKSYEEALKSNASSKSKDKIKDKIRLMSKLAYEYYKASDSSKSSAMLQTCIAELNTSTFRFFDDGVLERILATEDALLLEFGEKRYLQLQYIKGRLGGYHKLWYSVSYLMVVSANSKVESALGRLAGFLDLLSYARSNNDKAGEERIINRMLKDTAKFGVYRRCVEEFSHCVLSNPKISLLEAAVQTCLPQNGYLVSNERTIFLQQAEIAVSVGELANNGEFSESLKARLLNWMNLTPDKSQKVVALIALAEAVLFKRDYDSYCMYSMQMLDLLEEDPHLELKTARNQLGLGTNVVEWINSSISYVQKSPKRLALMQKLDKFVRGKQNFGYGYNRLVLKLYQELLNQGRDAEAQQILLEDLKRCYLKKETDYYSGFHLLCISYREAKKYKEIKDLLEDADRNVVSVALHPRTRIDLNDAWADYYLHVKRNKKKGEEYVQKSLQCAIESQDDSMLESHKNLLKYVQYSAF